MGEVHARQAEVIPLSRFRSRGFRTEQELLQAVSEGSEQALEELTLLHWDTAHRIAFTILGDRHTAEDVAQEALLSAIANIGRFDLRRPFAPWLHRIVANRALDEARLRRKQFEVGLETLPLNRHPQANGLDPEQVMTESSDDDLQRSLNRLSPDHLAVVGLRYIAGYGTNDIARLLDLPRGTVGSRLRRALDQLRLELKDTQRD